MGYPCPVFVQIRLSRANYIWESGSIKYVLGTYSGRVELICPEIYGDNIRKQRH